MTYDPYEQRYGVPEKEAELELAKKRSQGLTLGGFRLPAILQQLIGQKEKVLPGIQEERRRLKEQRSSFVPVKRAELTKEVTDPFAVEEEIARQEGGLNRALEKISDTEAQRGQTIDQLIGKASNLYGYEQTGAEQTYQNAKEALEKALSKATGEKEFVRGLTFSPAGLQAGVGADEILGAVGSPLRKMFEGMSTETRRQQALSEKNAAATAASENPLEDLLSISEAKQLGVPFGTKKSDVVGVTPGATTQSFDNFIREIDQSKFKDMSVDPQQLYRDYLEAQQVIDQNPDSFQEVKNDPYNSPYSHLLKPKSGTNDAAQLLMEMIFNQ